MATMNMSNAPNLLSTPNQAGQLSAPTSLLQAQQPMSGLLNSSYFPVSKQMGLPGQANDLINIMQNAGQGPQLQNVINAVQAQYNPEIYTSNGQSYGAGRFMRPTNFGAFTPTTSQTPAFSFTPGVFDINNYPALSNMPAEPVVAPVVTPVEPSGGGNIDFTQPQASNVAGTNGTTGGPAYDPYSALQNPESQAASAAGMIPGIGPIAALGFGAVTGWNNAEAANALATGMSAYGVDVTGLTTNAYTAALGKAFGIDTAGIQAAKALLGPNGTYSSAENLYGDLTATNDPSVSGIVGFINSRDGVPTTPDAAGKLGFDISTQIHSVIASSRGMGLNEAVAIVAQANGMSAAQATALAAGLAPDSMMQEVANNLNTGAMPVVNDTTGLLGSTVDTSVGLPALPNVFSEPSAPPDSVTRGPATTVAPMTEFTTAEKATFNDAMVAAAQAEGKTVQQKTYEVAISQGLTMAQVDQALGLPSGTAAGYEANGYGQDVANSTANTAIAQATAAVAASGGNVSHAQAEAIANATDDPIAAMIGITASAGYNQSTGSYGQNSMSPSNAVTDGFGNAVQAGSGGYVTYGD